MQGAMGAIAYVRGLRVLRIEDLHCRLEHEAVTDLGQLTQVCSAASTNRKFLTLTRHPFQASHCTAVLSQLQSSGNGMPQYLNLVCQGLPARCRRLHVIPMLHP